MPGPSSHGQSALRWVRWASLALLLGFCVVIALITFSSGPPYPEGQDALREFLVRAHRHGVPAWVSFGLIEFSANVVMFIPIGLFGALSLPRFRWLVIPAAIAASAVIEIVQGSDLPGRVGTPRDVVANGLGAAIGCLLAYLVVALVRHLARPKHALLPNGAGAATDGDRATTVITP